jgi:hypothetical protein
MANRPSLAFLAVLAFASALAAAEPGSAAAGALLEAFPDNVDIRARLFSSLIGAPRETAIAYGEKAFPSAAGKVTARAVQRDEDFLVEFRNGAMGSPSRGTCIIQRSNGKKNYILQAKVFLQDDPSCYLRLYPNPKGSSTFADIVMYGALLKRGLVVDGMLAQVLVKPLASVVASTRQRFDWGLVFPSAAAVPAPPRDPAELSRALADSPRPELLLAALPGAAELSDPVPRPEGFRIEGAEMGPGAAFGPFPGYSAGKGLPATALAAALYLDALANPGSAYALYGEGPAILAIPRFDDSGRFGIAVLSPGSEDGVEGLPAAENGRAFRVLRIGPAR